MDFFKIASLNRALVNGPLCVLRVAKQLLYYPLTYLLHLNNSFSTMIHLFYLHPVRMHENNSVPKVLNEQNRFKKEAVKTH